MLGRRHERLILKITIQGDPLQKGCTSSCTSWVTPTLPYPYPPCLAPSNVGALHPYPGACTQPCSIYRLLSKRAVRGSTRCLALRPFC